MKMDIDMKARLLFIAFLLVLAAGALIWYFLAAAHFATFRIYTKDSVSGLIVDAPIEFHGVEVGKVKSVKLLEPHLVSIVLNVEKDAPVSSATVATIISRGVAARGFTGYVYVSLEDAGTVASPLTAQPGEPYPVIPTAPAKVVTLDTAVNQVNANVQATTDLMRSVLDKKTVTSLRQSIDNLQQVSKALADNSAKLDSMITAAERASRHIEPLLESSQNAGGVQDVSRQVGPLLESGQSTARSLQSASGHLGPLLESSQGTVNTIQTQILPQMTKSLADLEILTKSFGDLANTINRDPSILIRGRTPAQRHRGRRNESGRGRWLAVVLCAALSCGCTLLTPVKTDTTTYVLNGIPSDLPRQTGPSGSLLVLVPETAPLYATRRMAYSTQAFQIGYFNESEWALAPGADDPASAR